MKQKILCPVCKQNSLSIRPYLGEHVVKCDTFACFKMPLEQWKKNHKSISIQNVILRKEQESAK